MRLLLVTPYYPEQAGGVEIVAGHLATRLAARGVDVRWVSSNTIGLAREEDSSVIRLPVRTWDGIQRSIGLPYPIWSPLTAGRLSTEVRRADVVHLHDTLCVGSVTAAALARASRTPLLVTQHIGPRPYRRTVDRLLMRAAVRGLSRPILATATQVVFISRTVMEFFHTVQYKRPPVFVPNGVDTTQFRPPTEVERTRARARLALPTDRPVALFVGRYVETKGIRVMRALAERRPDVTWVFVGHGPHDPVGWGLPQVRSDGQIAHASIELYYHAADVLVLPSTGEGFPLVVQEAMASGLPVVIPAETAAGVPEVRPLILEAAPTADAVADALRPVFARPERARRSAANAAAFVAAYFDWEACTDRYLELLVACARRGRGTNDR